MKEVNLPKSIMGFKVVQDIGEVLESLVKGETVCRYEGGMSMHPILRHQEYAKLIPIKSVDTVKIGDAVFCKLGDTYMTHMVTAISNCGFDGEKWFQIGSTRGDIYGWTKEIYAIAKGTDYFQKDEYESNPWWKRITRNGTTSY